MAEMKTKKTAASPESFLNAIKEEEKRKDAFTILELMKKSAKSEPKMWGSAIIGFGDSSYTLSNGKENPWFLMGFSPRKQNFALYLTGQKAANYKALVEKLGNFSTSQEDNKGCLYIKRIADVNIKALQELFESHIKAGKKS
jgi:hypothetical protein